MSVPGQGTGQGTGQGRRHWLRALVPRSLASRTTIFLLIGLSLVQAAGLVIHALDRLDLQTIAELRDAAVRSISLYRSVSLSRPDARPTVLAQAGLVQDIAAELSPAPPISDLPFSSPELQRQVRADMLLVPMPQNERPTQMAILGGPAFGALLIGMPLDDGHWVNMSITLPQPRPWHSPNFLAAFLLMTAVAALLTLWAVRRLIAPVGTLAAAAEALGRDVNAPDLPETGPSELAAAAGAFNTMAGRIRRFVQDRTFMLTAIGHDLRTPITRLKLRAEFVEDEELRAKILGDLDELQAMVSATLAVGRDITADEPATRVDLVALLRTMLDEISDTYPDRDGDLTYVGPDSLPIHARPLALKRALSNLVLNALAYGGRAEVRLTPPVSGLLQLAIVDDGPGIPPDKLDLVFQPFRRGEESRGRETGGVGLGLTIARNILRAHGGDVTLSNRHGGGLMALVVMPV